LQVLGTLTALTALSSVLSFTFCNFLRPGVSVRNDTTKFNLLHSFISTIDSLKNSERGRAPGQVSPTLPRFQLGEVAETYGTVFLPAFFPSACQLNDTKVVTGASDGIGREFAIQLAKAGFNVLLAARNQAKLDAVVDEIGAPLFI
jgi:hypothetical protein